MSCDPPFNCQGQLQSKSLSITYQHTRTSQSNCICKVDLRARTSPVYHRASSIQAIHEVAIRLLLHQQDISLVGRCSTRFMTKPVRSCRKRLDQCSNIPLVTDGWPNIRNESLIKYVAVMEAVLFLSSHKASYKSQTGIYSRNGLAEVIRPLSSAKVATILANNVNNMRSTNDVVGNQAIG